MEHWRVLFVDSTHLATNVAPISIVEVLVNPSFYGYFLNIVRKKIKKNVIRSKNNLDQKYSTHVGSFLFFSQIH